MQSLRECYPRVRAFLPLLAILLTVTALPAFGGEEVMTDGVLHIVNGAEPANGRQTVQLEELWRVGGEDDEENIFGIINKVLIDDEEDAEPMSVICYRVK